MIICKRFDERSLSVHIPGPSFQKDLLPTSIFIEYFEGY